MSITIPVCAKLYDVTLIGLTGAARCGKDTVGKILLELTGYPTYSLASPIKSVCNEIFGWDDRHSDGELKETIDPFWGISPRHAYQTLGTEWGRMLIRDDIWLVRAAQTYGQNTGLIVTDIRFENEAQFIRSNGGIIVKVTRDGIGQVKSHASESGIKLEPQDIVIENNSDIQTLRKEVSVLSTLIKTTPQE